MLANFKRLVLKNTTQSVLVIFLTLWFLLNLIQAKYTGLHADEAYYWLFTQFLQWGYFDHLK